MNKAIPISLRAAGAGGLGLGGWALSRPKVTDPYKEKYSFAILKDGDSALWDKKFKSLENANPTHETLRKATGSVGDESTRKSHHKNGCREIYESSVKDDKYLDDFKKYCSKNNEDAIGGSWIAVGTEDSVSPSKWNDKLKALKSKKDQETLQALKTLAGKVTDSPDKAQRDELKQWCDGQKSELFLGDNDPFTSGIKSYCIDG
ncbi:hypothetical protein HF1_09950 [Mycoplasma haemofelis str. Langford 1]|uniref:Uncharacterized protein n=1 Tax=Mycoplasma haemofelis (strain Langford 1) TaxID=941640 RepID=E8ZIN2_MYCHL|nr:hypothetical protein [Mycoplasma haemofelis]CBY93003.1 hypothetical protein HF1_09950 [Mycoplasma haemofelis str. Langford 1]